jgi:hypothetical protein
MKFSTILLLIISQTLVSCTALTLNFSGFLAFVYVDTRGYDLEVVNDAKTEVIEYIESLGFEEVNVSLGLKGDDKFVHYYRGPARNVHFYNLYLNNPTERISITIRDGRRTYSSSKELREEVDKLLTILKKYFDEERIRYEQQSTFFAS